MRKAALQVSGARAPLEVGQDLVLFDHWPTAAEVRHLRPELLHQRFHRGDTRRCRPNDSNPAQFTCRSLRSRTAAASEAQAGAAAPCAVPRGMSRAATSPTTPKPTMTIM